MAQTFWVLNQNPGQSLAAHIQGYNFFFLIIAHNFPVSILFFTDTSDDVLFADIKAV